MIFETDRLFARPWTIEDLDDAFAIYGNVNVMRYLGRDPKTPQTREEMHAVLTRWTEKEKERKPGHGAWALIRKEDEKPVGTIMCKTVPDGDNLPTDEVELGWHLGQQYWGNGYATEAARAVAEYGFKTLSEVDRFLALIYPENIASKKVATNIGMQPIGQSDKFYGMTLEVFELRRPNS